MKHCGGRGLVVAGVMVLVVGLAATLVRTLGIAGYWIPAVVGVALVVSGVVRHAGGG